MASPAAVLSVLVTAKGITSANAKLAGLDAAGKKAGMSADDMAERHEKGSKVIHGAAKVGVLAVGGLAAASLAAAGSFESSLNTFQAVSGSTGKEMDKVSKLAIQLGADVKLPGTSAKDAAEAMTELAKGGLSVRDSMGAARGVLQLSAAAQIGNAEAATITARALNAFSLKGKDAARVSDLLAGASNASTAEITDVAAGMQQAAASAHQLGVPIEDLTTSLGLMANAGIVGSDAGTSLKTMLSAFVPKSEAAGAVMKKLGLNTFNAKGEFVGIRKAADIYTKGLAGMTDEQKAATLRTIFGSDAQRAANVLLTSGTEKFDTMKKAVTKHGSAQELAAAKMKGFKGSLEAFKSTLETLAITFGSVLLPAATAAMGFLAGAFGGFGEHKTAVLAVIGVLGGLSAAILVVNLATKAWAATTAAFTAIQAAFNAVLALNPIALVAIALAALVAALVIAYHHSETFRDIVDAAFKVVTAAAEVMWDVIKFVFNAMVDTVTWAWGAIRDVTTAVWGVIGPYLTAVWGVIKTVLTTYFHGYVAVVTAVWNAIKAVTEAVWPVIQTILTTVWGVIKTLVTTYFGAYRTIIEGVWNAIKVVTETVWGAIRTVAETAWNAIKTIATTVWNGIRAAIIDPIESAVSGVRNALGEDGLLGWMRKRLDDFAELAEKLTKPFVAAFSAVLDVIKDVLKYLGKVSDVVEDVIDAIKQIKVPSVKIPDLNPFGGFGGGMVGPGGSVPAAVDGFNDDAARFGVSTGGPGQGFRPGDPGWHGKNRARDYSGGNMLAFAQYMAAKFGGKLLELIHTPLGFGIKNGQVVAPYAAADHYDHVHVALEKGGYLKQGGWAVVGERGPELAHLPGGSSVYSNRDSQQMLSGPTINVGTVNVGSRVDENSFLERLAFKVATA